MEAKPRTVEVYIAPNDTVPFDEWMGGLRDTKGKGQIDSRISRLERGLLGHYREVGDGLIELKLDNVGPGYRIYCADDGELVLILCAGTKRTQDADIAKARYYWHEFRGRR